MFSEWLFLGLQGNAVLFKCQREAFVCIYCMYLHNSHQKIQLILLFRNIGKGFVVLQ